MVDDQTTIFQFAGAFVKWSPISVRGARSNGIGRSRRFRLRWSRRLRRRSDRSPVPAEVTPDVEPAPGTRAHDPDLDPPPGHRPPAPGPYFAENQRLVANPFLALAALLPWLHALRLALHHKNLPLF